MTVEMLRLARRLYCRHHREIQLVLVAVIGFVLGRLSVTKATTTTKATPSSVVLGHVEDIPLRPTSHKSVHKHQLVEPFALHPQLSGVSVSTMDPTQHPHVEQHQHRSMGEFFFVLEGQGSVHVPAATTTRRNDSQLQRHALRPGSFVWIGPKQDHSFSIVESSESGSSEPPLKLLYFGLTDD